MNTNERHWRLSTPGTLEGLFQGLLYVVLSLSLCVTTSVAETKTYLVDLVIVTPTSSQWLKEEVFPTELPDEWQWFDQIFPVRTEMSLPADPIDPVNVVDNPVSNAAQLSTHPGRVQQRLLEQAQTRLTRSGRYRVLYQGSFVQEFQDLNQASRYWVQSDSEVRGQPELAGWLTFYRGRFLHVRSEMLLTEFGWEAADSASKSKQLVSELPPIGNTKGADEALSVSNVEEKVPQSRYWVKRIPVEHRQKLKSDDVYYLDHPGLGILIKLSPLGT
jgi:hypothetical protein